MKINLIIAGIGSIVLMTSCKSLKSIASKDTSSAPKPVATKQQGKDVAFLENIEVTPGSVVTSKHTTINTRNQKKNVPATENKPAVKVSQTEPNPVLAKNNIENASELQIKYAVLLDATVEKLENVSLLQNIDHWWGTPYRLGGTSESGIDCSAFTQAMMKAVYEISLLRTAHEQFDAAEHIEVSDLHEGDLVFFHSGGKKRRRVSHVGVYIMNNKFVHASTSSGVMISDLNDNYWKQRFHGAGRAKK